MFRIRKDGLIITIISVLLVLGIYSASEIKKTGVAVGIVADGCGDICDADNDGILDSDDLCKETDQASAIITENGCSCQQVKAALAARGNGYHKEVLSNKNIALCRAVQIQEKMILAKAGKAFAIEVGAIFSSLTLIAFMLFIVISLIYVYMGIKR